MWFVPLSQTGMIVDAQFMLSSTHDDFGNENKWKVKVFLTFFSQGIDLFGSYIM